MVFLDLVCLPTNMRNKTEPFSYQTGYSAFPFRSRLSVRRRTGWNEWKLKLSQPQTHTKTKLSRHFFGRFQPSRMTFFFPVLLFLTVILVFPIWMTLTEKKPHSHTDRWQLLWEAEQRKNIFFVVQIETVQTPKTNIEWNNDNCGRTTQLVLMRATQRRFLRSIIFTQQNNNVTALDRRSRLPW